MMLFKKELTRSKILVGIGCLLTCIGTCISIYAAQSCGIYDMAEEVYEDPYLKEAYLEHVEKDTSDDTK